MEIVPKGALPAKRRFAQALSMTMFLATPEPVNLESLIESTIDWLDQRALSRSAGLGRALPLSFRWSFRLWPARCLLCQAVADLRYLDLCRDCLRALPFVDEPSSCLVPLRYAAPVDDGLRALKYRADWRWAAIFGALSAAWSAAKGVPPVSMLVPMPLHAERKAERGFNQAAQIAKFAAIWLGVPVNQHLLVRARATRPQTTLSAARRSDNVRGAFELHPRYRSGTRAHEVIALIDDVRTTGATLDAASATLATLPWLNVQRWAVASAMPMKTASPAW